MPEIGERRVRTATFVVAASNSMVQDKAMADYVCDGVNDHVEIQAALDALPATGGEVKLLDGTYTIESSLVLDSYQTLRGCGRNTILTTTTAVLDIITAIGGAGTEKVGIIIADLCVNGSAGGAINGNGILWTYVDSSIIRNLYLQNNGGDGGIFLSYCDNNIIQSSHISNNTSAAIWIDYSSYNIVQGNNCNINGFGIICTVSPSNSVLGNRVKTINHEAFFIERSNYCVVSGNYSEDADYGVLCDSSTYCVVTNNIIRDSTTFGIFLDDSYATTVSNNYVEGSGGSNIMVMSENNTITSNVSVSSSANGIQLEDFGHNNVSCNICQGNAHHGIDLRSSPHNNVANNNCTENSQAATNTYDDIELYSADYNNIQGNTCRAGALANKPRYGINISNAACDKNLVIDNDLYNDGFGTAPFNDAGTGTKLNTYKVPFSSGSDPQDSGFLIDAGAEMARTWLRLPPKVHQVVRMKVYARSVVLEADKMRGEFVVYGGADNEPYTTHDGSVANHPSTSLNFAANDIVFWTINTAGLIALTGGDSVEVKVIYEDAGGADCATNAYLRTVEIEYV